jgi:hypothetical protein
MSTNTSSADYPTDQNGANGDVKDFEQQSRRAFLAQQCGRDQTT